MVFLALELDLSSPEASSLATHKDHVNLIAVYHCLFVHMQNLQMAKYWLLFKPLSFTEQASLTATDTRYFAAVTAVTQLFLRMLWECSRALTKDQVPELLGATGC